MNLNVPAASACESRARRFRRDVMQDAIFTVVTIAFFVLSLAYVRFCERVK